MNTNISVEQALHILLNQVKPLGDEFVRLTDSLGRVLSHDIMAQENVPGFNRSPLDGYALRGIDTALAKRGDPVTLKVLEEVSAGHVATQKVVPGTAIKVMTGTPIPEGADVVIRYEQVVRKDDAIEVFIPLKPGSNIVLAGEDVRKGEMVASQGMVIKPPVIGLLASLGISEVPVFLKPKVAIISTGDELVDVQESLKPGQIHNSNSYCLAAYCLELGVEPLIMGNSADHKGDLEDKISQGLSIADIVITTGGVSVGDCDFTPDVLASMGADILFWGVDIKPGAPTLAAVKNNKRIVSLSGNPASALIVFQLLVLPMIKKMMGHERCMHSVINVVLADSYKKNSPSRRFLRGRLTIKDGDVRATLTGAQSNGILRSMIGCNLLLDVPAGSSPLKNGDKLQGFLIEDLI